MPPSCSGPVTTDDTQRFVLDPLGRLPIPWILAVIGVRKLRGLAFLPPDLLASFLGIPLKLTIPIVEVSIDCRLCLIYRFVIAVVDDGTRHAAED